MPAKTKFTLNQEPREIDIEDVDWSALTTVFATGIVNPMGPTFNALVANGFFWKEQRHVLLQVMLNPFSQSCHEVGTVEFGDGWSVDDVRPFFSLPFGSCPTLLLPSALLSPKMAHALFTGLLQGFEDASAVWDRVRRHPGDPWEPVEAEMPGEVEALADSETRDKHPALSPREAREFAKLQLAPQNLSAEFKAFLFAWEGSIGFLGFGTMGMKKEEFLRILGSFMATIRVPFAQNIIDNPDLLKRE